MENIINLIPFMLMGKNENQDAIETCEVRKEGSSFIELIKKCGQSTIVLFDSQLKN